MLPDHVQHGGFQPLSQAVGAGNIGVRRCRPGSSGPVTGAAAGEKRPGCWASKHVLTPLTDPPLFSVQSLGLGKQARFIPEESVTALRTLSHGEHLGAIRLASHTERR